MAKWLAILISLACAALAGAQSTSVDLQPVEAGVADISALDTSLRVIESGLAQPSGFSQIYRVPGRDDLFTRANGAVYAVFPSSVYVPTPFGRAPVVPAGTVFHIGAPAYFQAQQAQAPVRPEGLVDDRIDNHVAQAPLAAESFDVRLARVEKAQVPSQRVAGEHSLVNDPAYRAQRLHQLMHIAARFERASIKAEANTLRDPATTER